MGRVVDVGLFNVIHDFFKVYLPNQRRCSQHTIRAYRTAVDGFIDFVREQRCVELLSVTFEMLNSGMLSAYLDSIEAKGCGVATRNARLNGIRSFFAYASKMDITAIAHKADISKIPLKKPVEVDIVAYMSEKAVKALLAQPNPLTKKGLRDGFLMLMMYDTAARIDSVLSIRLCDVKLGKTPTVTLHTKGGKEHSVPLMKQTAEHYKNYLKVFHPDESAYSEQPLFFTLHYGCKTKMDESTVRKFIGAYADVARERCTEIPKGVHPHMLRHSRAMHLYQHGMELTLVSQWLGHVQLDTTLVYARADTEQKRKAIESATPMGSPLKEKLNSKRFSVTDDETLKRLYGLK